MKTPLSFEGIPRELSIIKNPQKTFVNTKNWCRKKTDLWAEFGKETPFGRKFSSEHSVKIPAVGSSPSFGTRVVLRLEKEAFGNT
jgi:hypothetical protein